jgi:hypothetical protein
VLAVLALDEERYEQLVAVTREMLDTPAFLQLRDNFAWALAAVPA